MIDKWDRRFMDMAKLVSTWSKDPSSKIGAVAVDSKGVILSTGWNGFPRGIADTEERLNNRELKYQYVVHAEKNCIYNAGFIGAKLDGATLYVYGLPVCSECAKGIIQVGIRKVVMYYPVDVPAKWQDEFAKTKALFKEVGIECVRLVGPNENQHYSD